MKRNDCILINSAQLEEKILEQVCKFSLWNMDRGEKLCLYVVIINVYNAQCHREPVRHVWQRCVAHNRISFSDQTYMKFFTAHTLTHPHTHTHDRFNSWWLMNLLHLSILSQSTRRTLCFLLKKKKLMFRSNWFCHQQTLGWLWNVVWR